MSNLTSNLKGRIRDRQLTYEERAKAGRSMSNTKAKKLEIIRETIEKQHSEEGGFKKMAQEAVPQKMKKEVIRLFKEQDIEATDERTPYLQDQQGNRMDIYENMPQGKEFEPNADKRKRLLRNRTRYL
jgi:hypothetical protein